jgi:hypothetical protein
MADQEGELRQLHRGFLPRVQFDGEVDRKECGIFLTALYSCLMELRMGR